MTNRNPDTDTVIHTPCGRDWIDYRGHHECRSTMDHRGLCVSRTSHGEHPSLIGNPGITLCPVEGVTAQIDKDDGTCWACGTRVLPPAEAVERCPECRHMPHGSLGFCPNMASDNECSCTYVLPPETTRP